MRIFRTSLQSGEELFISDLHVCNFLKIPLLQNVNSIEVAVPVGNVEHTIYVVAVTSFIVSGATVYLLVTLFREVENSK